VHDVTRYKAAVRSARKTEQDLWGKAVMFGVAALVILIVVAHMH
jgi:hypothetical protein